MMEEVHGKRFLSVCRFVAGACWGGRLLSLYIFNFNLSFSDFVNKLFKDHPYALIVRLVKFSLCNYCMLKSCLYLFKRNIWLVQQYQLIQQYMTKMYSMQLSWSSPSTYGTGFVNPSHSACALTPLNMCPSHQLPQVLHRYNSQYNAQKDD